MTTGDMAGSLTSAEGQRTMQMLADLREAGVDVERIKERNPIPRDLYEALLDATRRQDAP